MSKSVNELIKQATEAVKDVPENLQQIAFSKAFDAMLASQNLGSPSRPAKPSTRRGSTESGNRLERSQLDTLDRTQYPLISADSTALANSLRVLLAARDDLGIDGLSASDVTYLLVDKFRCKVTRQAISQCLNAAGQLVNRHKDGNAVIFRIMARGETYLQELESDDGTGRVVRKTKRSNSAKSRTNSKKVAEVKTKKGSAGKSPGAKAVLTQLYDAGFFKNAQTISSIIEHLKHNLGRSYKPNQMSPALLRYLRSGKLRRTKNGDNQYEYVNA